MTRTESAAILKQPRVRLKVLHRLLHPLPDGQLRLPSEPANFFRIQKDERAVAGPAPVAAGVPPLGVDAEFLADPADRVVHLAVVVRAEAVYVHLTPGLGDHR